MNQAQRDWAAGLPWFVESFVNGQNSYSIVVKQGSGTRVFGHGEYHQLRRWSGVDL